MRDRTERIFRYGVGYAGARPSKSLEITFFTQLLVGAGDGYTRDLQLCREASRRRHRLSRPQSARHNGLPKQVVQLLIQRVFFSCLPYKRRQKSCPEFVSSNLRHNRTGISYQTFLAIFTSQFMSYPS